jgi:hypothetical protein
MEKLTEEKREYQTPELVEYENLNEVTAAAPSGLLEGGFDSI